MRLLSELKRELLIGLLIELTRPEVLKALVR